MGMVGVLSSVHDEVGLETCDDRETGKEDEAESDDAERILT